MSIIKLIEALDTFLEAVARGNRTRILAPYEKRIERDFMRLFKKQGALFAAEHAKHQGDYQEAIGDPEFAEIMDTVIEATSADMEEALTVPMSAAMKKAAEKLLGELGMDKKASIGASFTLKNPKAVAWLEGHCLEASKIINDTTKAEIKTMLTQATSEGWSYDRTARLIKNRFTEFAVGQPQKHIDSRAHLVAVTESRFAYEKANMQTAKAMQAAGLELEKSWYSSGDESTCDDCAGNSDDGWIPVDDSFSSGDDEPPPHPGCRCTAMVRRVGATEEGGQGD